MDTDMSENSGMTRERVIIGRDSIELDVQSKNPAYVERRMNALMTQVTSQAAIIQDTFLPEPAEIQPMEQLPLFKETDTTTAVSPGEDVPAKVGNMAVHQSDSNELVELYLKACTQNQVEDLKVKDTVLFVIWYSEYIEKKGEISTAHINESYAILADIPVAKPSDGSIRATRSQLVEAQHLRPGDENKRNYKLTRKGLSYIQSWFKLS